MLKDIHFTIPHGKSIALVGPSGGGKTTICSLIPRFYDVTKGKIEIGQQNIKDVQLKSLRQAIGIVQQDVYLFADTIRENILYGNPKATEEEMIEAAKKSTYSFIYLFFTKRLLYICRSKRDTIIGWAKTKNFDCTYFFEKPSHINSRRSNQCFR